MSERVDPRHSLILSRRRLLQLMAAATGTLALRPTLLARIAAAPEAPDPGLYGFLTADERAILEAAVETILPSDRYLPGAKEIGVADYIQSLLSFLPGSDANCDRYVGAADLIAVEAKALGHSLGCTAGRRRQRRPSGGRRRRSRRRGGGLSRPPGLRRRALQRP